MIVLRRDGYADISESAVEPVIRWIVSLRQMCLTMNIDIPSIVKHICRKGTYVPDVDALYEEIMGRGIKARSPPEDF